MAVENAPETESQRRVDEETPLLVSHDSQSEHADADKKDEPEPKQLAWWLWRGFWTLVALLILGGFIKGWIDTGSDVNVRCTG
jgi:hypothetical protein